MRGSRNKVPLLLGLFLLLAGTIEALLNPKPPDCQTLNPQTAKPQTLSPDCPLFNFIHKWILGSLEAARSPTTEILHGFGFGLRGHTVDDINPALPILRNIP